MSFDFSTASDLTTNPLSYFSDRGEDYEKYRPIHPASAIDAILSDLGSPTQLVAADVGAGTGIGARLLADRGVRVMATVNVLHSSIRCNSNQFSRLGSR